MKIIYELKFDNYGGYYSDTKCPNGKTCYVGSMHCQECENYRIGFNSRSKGEVKCNYGEIK